MLSSFRRFSKSTAGSIVLALFVVAIMASFALGDIAGLGGGSSNLSGSTLAKVGGEMISDRDMSRVMERRLGEVRQQDPQAEYSAIASDFDPLLNDLIDQRALQAFAAKNGFEMSKRLIDAEIANIPGTKGLDGKFSEDAYRRILAQQRISDQ